MTLNNDNDTRSYLDLGLVSNAHALVSWSLIVLSF